MKRVIILMIAMLIGATAQAQDLALDEPMSASRWTKMDLALELTCLTLLAADGVRTVETSIDRHSIREGNPLLGHYPSPAKVAIYFLSVSALHVAIAYLLPQPWRFVFQSITIGVQVAVLYSNATLAHRPTIGGVTFGTSVVF